MAKKALVSLAFLAAFVALVASCGGGNNQQSSASVADSSDSTAGLKPVEDSRPAAYMARIGRWMYDWGVPKGGKAEVMTAKTELLYGEKLYLVGETKNEPINGAGDKYDWVKVRRALGGAEGWTLDLYLLKEGTLGVVKAECFVYSLPNSAAYAKTKLPAMQMVNIKVDPSASGFYKVEYIDPSSKAFKKDLYLKSSDVSLTADDVQSAVMVLIALSKDPKDATQKEQMITLLKEALANYPSSAFAPRITTEIAKLEDVTPATTAPAGGQYQVAAIASASVYDKVPADPQSASVVYTLGQGESVTVLEESASQVSFDGKTGVWLKVSYDDSGASKQGWVFSADFAQ